MLADECGLVDELEIEVAVAFNERVVQDVACFFIVSMGALNEFADERKGRYVPP